MKALLCENRTAALRFLTENNGLLTVKMRLLNMIGLYLHMAKVGIFFISALFPFNIATETWFLIRVDHPVIDHSVYRTAQVTAA